MSVPAPNKLTLGRLMLPTTILSMEDVQAGFDYLNQSFVAMGSPAPALQGSDTPYQAVYATYDGSDWTLWAGKADDPQNPDEITIAGGVSSTAVEIWAIDPAGGHTITTTGTSLSLNLKIKKYTFSVVDPVSSTDDTLTITYSTGTECAE